MANWISRAWRSFHAGHNQKPEQPLLRRLTFNDLLVRAGLRFHQPDTGTHQTSVNQELQDLISSEERYRNLVETSRDMIWSVDREGRWTFVNQAVRTIYGYEPKEMIGRHFTDFQSVELRQRDLETFKDILKGQSYFHYETEHQRKDGTPVRLLFNATPLIDDGGNTIGTTGTATDVTERTRATLALQQQRETLRQVIDIIPYPIFIKNSQGTVLLANQAFCSLFGKSTEEVIGSDYRLINRSLEIAERHIAEDIQVIQTRQPFFTAEEMVPNEQSGELHWFQTIKVPMLTTGSNEVSALGVAIDITERKRAEEALRATVEGTASATAEHFFNSLVQHLAEALATKIAYVGKLVTEGDRKYIQVLSIWNGNSHAEQFCFPIEGTPSAEVVAKGFRHLTKVAENYPDRPWFKENEVSDYLGMPIFTGSGQPLGILAVLHDSPVADRQITRTLLSIFAARAGAEIERLEAEESRAALQRQLLQSQKMEAIGQLAAGVAHDLNNALGAVVGHLQLIKLDLDEHSPLGPSLEVALKGCSRATSLIGQLLGFSRQGKYNPKIIRIRDAVKETLDFVSKIIGKDLKIDFQSQLNDLPIKADPAQLQQVLINLLINAKQAMPNGGSIFIDSFVSDQLAPQQFNSKATPGKYAVIRIRDTGTGIPREHLDKIFEPFFTTKSEGRGTGLGLPMAYGIMQNHGGWIGLESKVGEGTAFSLYFPLCQTNALPAETSGVITSSKSHGTVMVVDDEQYLVTLSKTFLEREGLLVHGFTSPHEAIGWYRMNWREIDLVVLDMKMPGIDGSQCFDEIKKINQHAVIIMLSGYIHDELAQSLLVRGARAFFSKPLEYQQLVKWVKQYLAQRDGVAAVEKKQAVV